MLVNGLVLNIIEFRYFFHDLGHQVKSFLSGGLPVLCVSNVCRPRCSGPPILKFVSVFHVRDRHSVLGSVSIGVSSQVSDWFPSLGPMVEFWSSSLVMESSSLLASVVEWLVSLFPEDGVGSSESSSLLASVVECGVHP